MNIAMILAGGVGRRMGYEIPKQFIEILGKPVLVYTLEVFQQDRDIDAIEVVCIPEYKEKLKILVENYGLTKVKWIVDAGDTYQHSVIQGIQGLRGFCQTDDIILIHFGVSPFVTEEEIADSILVCKRYGNAIAATPCFLCLCQKDNEESSVISMDRDAIMGLNSPQTFRFGVLCQMYEDAERKQILDKTEPHTTSLMFALKMRLYFSRSSQRNIKITTQEDLELFEGYVMRHNRRKEGII